MLKGQYPLTSEPGYYVQAQPTFIQIENEERGDKLGSLISYWVGNTKEN